VVKIGAGGTQFVASRSRCCRTACAELDWAVGPWGNVRRKVRVAKLRVSPQIAKTTTRARQHVREFSEGATDRIVLFRIITNSPFRHIRTLVTACRGGGLPVQLAYASCRQSHVNRLGKRKLPHRNLARPPALLHPFVKDGEGVLERPYARTPTLTVRQHLSAVNSSR
jgi:hypothetical protein